MLSQNLQQRKSGDRRGIHRKLLTLSNFEGDERIVPVLNVAFPLVMQVTVVEVDPWTSFQGAMRERFK
jgi:hypothetical protein